MKNSLSLHFNLMQKFNELPIPVVSSVAMKQLERRIRK